MVDESSSGQPTPEKPQSLPVPETSQPTPIGPQEGAMAGTAQQAIKNEQPDEGLREIAGETLSPRQEIDRLNKSIRDHYRGKWWGKDDPRDPAERQRILDREFAEHASKTGFPEEDKRHLEFLSNEYNKALESRTKGYSAQWTLNNRPQIARRIELQKAEQKNIDIKLGPKPSAAIPIPK